MSIETFCGMAPVIPVLTVDDAATAPDLAKALVAGGLPVLEVTLRTPAALDAVKAMVAAVPDAVVGVGTVMNPADMAASAVAGAKFAVSPGCTDAIVAASKAEGVPLLPGVATPSEAMRATEHGLEILKFFPAEQNGGAPVLRAWAAPLRRIRFCPTGGVSPSNAPDYLSLPNVVCVGGSWVAPKDAVAAGDWARIEALAREAAALPRG